MEIDQDERIGLTDQRCSAFQQDFLNFLEGFTLPEEEAASQGSQGGTESDRAYVAKAAEMYQMDRTTMDVDFAHLTSWDIDLAAHTRDHHYRLEPYFRKAVQNFISKHQQTFIETPDGVLREFHVSFYNLHNIAYLRELKTEFIGKLVAFEGTCTRTSEVHPELFIGTFKCNDCGETVKDVEQQFKYTKPVICPNNTCGNRTKWTLQRDESAFVDWQKAKVQESADQVPAGSLPRTMEVILRNSLVESVRAGDRIIFAGTLIVVPDVAAISAPGERVESRPGRSQGQNVDAGVQGPKFLGVRELTYKLAFMASSTQAADTAGGLVNIRSESEVSDVEVLATMTPEEKLDVQSMMNNPHIYGDVARSLAPGVFGAEDIKKAVLLMLLGGVHKQTPEGINLRGDINVAIVGDPSCAKSQILKYVAAFLPRAVYTSGKSSSAAGLTASVVKEQDSNEFCIEAGALMLADNGICCIDEFDKMDVKDQVAIHEAMEQQTISLAKAGVQATLSARTAILAAANPMGGRYDRSKPLRYNVALPPAILSRFDLLHVMIDEPDEVQDERIANHIVAVHQRRDLALDAPYKMSQIQNYIRYARTIKPELLPEACTAIVASYAKLRNEDANPGSSTAYRITVRQLEALVRLAEALARLHCHAQVTRGHVQEAVRLVKHSIMQVESVEAEIDEEEMYDDLEGVAETVNRFNNSRNPDNNGGGGGGDPSTGRSAGDEDDHADDDDDDDDAAAPGGGAAGAGPMETDAPADPQGRIQAQQRAQAEAREAVAATNKKTRVSQKKVDEVKRLLTMKLLEIEKQSLKEAGEEEEKYEAAKERRAQEAAAEDAAILEREQLEDAQAVPEDELTEKDKQERQKMLKEREDERVERPKRRREVEIAAAPDAARKIAGITQNELLIWYFNYMTSGEQSRLTSSKAVQDEAILVRKIVQYLIKRESVIIVVEAPVQGEAEENADYNVRMQRERVLALNPDYSPE